MNKDNIKGKMNDMAGRAERQVGEWTGDEKAQAEGLGKQIKGKAQNAVGNVKEAGQQAADKVRKGVDRDRDVDVRPERDEEVA